MNLLSVNFSLMANVTANEKYFLHVRLEHQGHTDINIYYLQEHITYRHLVSFNILQMAIILT